MEKFDIIVIGAGASGLVAAGRAAELGANVLLLEKMERVGRKLLITGKGRCNITNSDTISNFLKKTHPNSKFLKPAFSNFFSQDIINLFEKYGVETKVERGGRIFPTSDSAAKVVEALLEYVKNSGAKIMTHCRVKNLLFENDVLVGVKVSNKDKTQNIFAKKIIIATGGLSYPATGSTGDGYRFAESSGHNIIKTQPALVPIETEGRLSADLQGLSLKNVKAIVWVNKKKLAEDFGEMLFTHYGLSGPIILTLSRLIVQEFDKKNEIEISIDLKPALDDPKLDKRLQRDLNENGKKQIVNVFKQWLPSKLIPVFLKKLGITANKESHQISAKERKKIRLLMKNLRFKVSGYRAYKEAIITAGGIDTTNINKKTMASKIVENLYFAGEVIDINAETGGYNLQIAFSTAYLAAESAVKSCNIESL